MPDQLLRCFFEHMTKSLGEVGNPQVKLWTSWSRDLARGEVENQKAGSQGESCPGSKASPSQFLMKQVAEKVDGLVLSCAMS